MKLITTREAAERLGVTPVRVRAMILAGRLPAEKFGHVHMIREADLALVAERRPGRPPLAGGAKGGRAGKRPAEKGDLTSSGRTETRARSMLKVVGEKSAAKRSAGKKSR